jgi:3-deoxy-7-phosphoheptulonate synthase
MIVVMEPEATDSAIEAVIRHLVSLGFNVHRSSGHDRTILGVVGAVSADDVAVAREFPGVAEVVRVSEPYRLASRRFRQNPSVVEGTWGSIGGERPWIAIEPVGLDPKQVSPLGELPYEVAAGRPFDAAVTRSRKGPESFGALVCLPLHPNPTEPRFSVLFVERAPSWGANSWIGAAEKALGQGSGNVVLLESGGEYPNGARTLEIAAIARVKQRSHLPIVVDVPTIAQRARYSSAVACAAIAAGADGLVLRVWVGAEDQIARMPATLGWSEAVELADRLRRVAAVVRP